MKTTTGSTVFKKENNMPHSNTKIWIHLIFSTKDRAPIIDESFEQKLYTHIERKLSREYDCIAESVNGTKDHLHILFRMGEKHSIENIVKNIKGESSHWINQSSLSLSRFAWQTGYSAFSISIDKVQRINEYIKNQKEHHKRRTFAEEYAEFSKIYGIKKE